MNKKTRILILFFLCLFLMGQNSNAQVYELSLKKNICQISECQHPKNQNQDRFKLKGFPREERASNDSFILDFNKKTFKWSDRKRLKKETSEFKMYNVKTNERKDYWEFVTEYQSVKLRMRPDQKEAILEIVFLDSNSWIHLMYACVIE